MPEEDECMSGTSDLPPIENYLMDMDGVLVRGTQLIPGAAEFIE